ncbi:hypothetical protein QR680_019037 [Steinernema hermaphroditum]|uniref:G-protein coupled receptors family 1 profile domain-containing protein n=1 Tax=Steinernema hermaphroditum TaxID=289476 RepID=A0AA39HLZ2_9BILA|nr:hypothetical protein QR680_019037 [Steinernema hermaphroditum]
MGMSDLWLDYHPAVNAIRWVIFVIATSGNVFIVFLILKNKKMRCERFNLLIILLAVGDVVLGCGAAVRACQSYITRIGGFTRINCIALGAVTIYGDHIAQIAMLIIAVDRFDGIFRMYKCHADTIYRIYVAIIPMVLSISLVPTGLIFIGVRNNIVRVCPMSVLWHPRFGDYMFGSMLFFNLGILVLYASIFILYKRYVSRTIGSYVSGPRNNFQPIVYGVVTVCFLFWCIPKWIMYGLKIFNCYDDNTNNAAFLIELSEGVSACLNILVYGYAHRELRNTMKAFLRKTPFRRLFATNSSSVRSGHAQPNS